MGITGKRKKKKNPSAKGASKVNTASLVFTAGGSGGHVMTALATIEALIREFPEKIKREEILFVGSNRSPDGEGESFEQKVVPEFKIRLKTVSSGKLPRWVTWKLIPNFCSFLLGVTQSVILLSKEKPGAVVSFGGYASVPVVVAAKLLGVRVILHEQGSKIGLSNKIASKFARVVITSYETTKDYLPFEMQDKVTVQGNPCLQYAFTPVLEKKKLSKDRYNALITFKRRRKKYPIIFIGGSGLGSHSINRVVFKILKQLLRKYQVILHTGNNKKYKDYDKALKIQEELEKDLAKRLLIIDRFNSEIGYIYDMAALAIGRSGSSFVYEVMGNKLPTIFIPLTWTQKGEQLLNAQETLPLGFTTIVNQEELTSKKLLGTVEHMLEKFPPNQNIEVDERLLKSRFPKDADMRVADLVTQLAM